MPDGFTIPTLGAIRLDRLRFDVEPLIADLALFDEEDWDDRDYSQSGGQSGGQPDGESWNEVQLIADTPHPKLAQCPALAQVLATFPGRPIDMLWSRLRPGAAVGLHRDISGGGAMGVARFHVPIITNPGVIFMIDGQWITMAPGEVWSLDTTYPHAVTNRGDTARVHLIVDVEATPAIRRMLPPPSWRTRLHTVEFAAACVAKAAQMVLREPRALTKRVVDFGRLRVLRRPTLFD
ncbi:MAG: aspartyl/asparaginyl beta-hydroxylase domain-containing protein [Myxococcota bacterium]